MNEMTFAPPPGVTMADYQAIEEAVMETARGRWFLMEYARRQRAVETQRLTNVADRLEALLTGATVATAAPPTPPSPPPASEAAEAVAEQLSDIIWNMRERGQGDQFCRQLDKLTEKIRALGSLSSQRPHLIGERQAPNLFPPWHGDSPPASDDREEVAQAATMEAAAPAATIAIQPPIGETLTAAQRIADGPSFASGEPASNKPWRSIAPEAAASTASVENIEVPSAGAQLMQTAWPATSEEAPNPWPDIDRPPGEHPESLAAAQPEDLPSLNRRLAALLHLDTLPFIDKLALFC